MGKAPKENPEDRKARLRERRIAGIERDTATQKTAADLTSDLRSIYGFRGIPLMFGSMGAPAKPTRPPMPRPLGGSNR
jgi:hypothetical protein